MRRIRLDFVALINFVIQISLATALNFFLSFLLFRRENLAMLETLHQNLLKLELSPMLEAESGKLRKMYELWPAYSHPAFYLLYSLFSYYLMREFIEPNNLVMVEKNHVDEQFKDKKKEESFWLRFLSSFLVSSFVFVLTVPMWRIGEMHLFVILINYIHLVMSMLMMNIVFYKFPSLSFPLFKSVGEKEKEE